MGWEGAGERGNGGGAGAVRAAPVGLAPELAVPRAPRRTGLTAAADFASWKAWGCSRASRAFLNQKCGRDSERVGGGERGGGEKEDSEGGERARAPGTEAEEERGSGGGDPANSFQ